MPTASRTAVCSLTTPEEYSSGIDQPPKSANFAPSATCRSCSGDVSGEVLGRGLCAVHARNLPRLSCAGEYLHAARCQPCEDALRRGGRRGGAGRQGSRERAERRARRGGRRESVRSRVPAPARLPRRDRQARRGHQGADRQAAVVAAARARRAGQARQGRGAVGRRRTPGRGRRVASRHQHRLGRDRPPRRVGGARACGDRGVPARGLHVHDVQEEGRRRVDEGARRGRGALPVGAEEGVRPGLRGGAGRVGGGRRRRAAG